VAADLTWVKSQGLIGALPPVRARGRPSGQVNVACVQNHSPMAQSLAGWLNVTLTATEYSGPAAQSGWQPSIFSVPELVAPGR
jgi:hypothetical protein